MISYDCTPRLDVVQGEVSELMIVVDHEKQVRTIHSCGYALLCRIGREFEGHVHAR